MKQKLNIIPVILLVFISCNKVDINAEKERAYFYQETMLGFNYIVSDHYASFMETYGPYNSGEILEAKKRLKNVFDANSELKGIVDYRMIENNRNEEEKRKLLFDALDNFLTETSSNVPKHFKDDFLQYIKNLQFNKVGFNEIHVLDSTDRHIFLTKMHMATTRAIQMNYH